VHSRKKYEAEQRVDVSRFALLATRPKNTRCYLSCWSAVPRWGFRRPLMPHETASPMTGEFVAGSPSPSSQRIILRNAHPVLSRGGDARKNAELSDEWLDICRGVPMRLLGSAAQRTVSTPHITVAFDDRYASTRIESLRSLILRASRTWIFLAGKRLFPELSQEHPKKLQPAHLCWNSIESHHP
jgi:hypothetical protein